MLGEVLASGTGSALSKAEEGLAAHRQSQGMFRGFLPPPSSLWGRVSYLERQGALSWAIAHWEERALGRCCSSGADGRGEVGSGAPEPSGAGLEHHLPSLKDCSW